MIHKDIKEVLHNFTLILSNRNNGTWVSKTFGEYGIQEFKWFKTFFYPTLRFVIHLPEYRDFFIQSVSVRTKHNVSLEVRFQDAQSFTRTFSFEEKAKQQSIPALYFLDTALIVTLGFHLEILLPHSTLKM